MSVRQRLAKPQTELISPEGQVYYSKECTKGDSELCHNIDQYIYLKHRPILSEVHELIYVSCGGNIGRLFFWHVVDLLRAGRTAI